MTDALYLADLGADPAPGDLIEVTGDEGRHAAVVKRTRVGEMLLVADGAGRAICGQVIEASKQSVVVRVDGVLAAPQHRHRWTAVQALAKGDRSEIAVESLTELGVDRVVAWQASRCVVRWDARPGIPDKSAKGVAKWQAVARAATKQSRRFRVPAVEYASTDNVVALILDASLALVAHEEATVPLAAVELPADGEVVVIIGPEGGISPDELQAFEEAGAKLVSLGDGVLRTSSAGVVSLAQLQVLAAQQGIQGP
ncbi:16S rRNA (uracil(1498)-N(3))-methyltransferase [Brooklawnia sp.]|uniref:16S rRNA (uracil(1498)-N(3))-methyltransferase n=1 Tax=Brooklawnia sp. TaxID=2699740 RepID=UPI00311F1757